MELNRRDFLLAGVAGLSSGIVLTNRASAMAAAGKSEEVMGGEVTAVEDLMREHGVLRRILFVYSESANRLRSKRIAVAPDAIQKAAKLFRAFGEDYHERKLEEAFIFPSVKKAGGEAAGYPDILVAQHRRGQEITDYILSVTRRKKIEDKVAEPLARAMESMVRMYRPHAAREDTIIFPAWKQTLTAKQLDEMNDKFEDIEHQQFGKEGFKEAIRQISNIENELGMADLAQFTASPISI
jgi:hemerythrin-like domain-containing protein